ncbi:hypothetical protein ACLOJK_022860 [Asimina triloba]
MHTAYSFIQNLLDVNGLDYSRVEGRILTARWFADDVITFLPNLRLIKSPLRCDGCDRLWPAAFNQDEDAIAVLDEMGFNPSGFRFAIPTEIIAVRLIARPTA